MKKVTKKQKIRDKQLQLKKNIFESKKALHNKDKIQRKLIAERKSKLIKQNIKEEDSVFEEITVPAPEVFGLIDQISRHLLLKFLKKIKYYLSQGYRVHISFDQTSSLLPCGTLLATAEIESLLDLYPNKISCSYPINNTVEQLFQHIGLLKKLGKFESRIEIDADNVRFWHYVSGTSTDDVNQFIPFFEYISLTEDTSSGLFDSMSEAVTNAIHHAYKEGQSKEWRMFAQHTNGALDVAICDLGMGIPCSLREKPELKDWIFSPLRSAKINRDKSLIALAVESTSSSTKLPHRGKGLKDMLDLVKNGTVGGFRIFSAKGVFNYDALSGQQKGIDYGTSINGTIIQWRISLEPEREH